MFNTKIHNSMVENLFFDNLDTFDDIDTSDVDIDESYDDSYDLYDSFATVEDIELDDIDEFQGFVAEDSSNNDFIDSTHEHHHESNKTSQISFTGLGRCRVCNCGGWAGFGDTCENCGHFFNKHI